jgi:hypothetical protein
MATPLSGFSTTDRATHYSPFAISRFSLQIARCLLLLQQIRPMTVQFNYDRQKVLQALRYHFINKKDIRFMLILVNIVSLVSAGLYFARLIEPTVFLMTSLMWIILMILFWFLMPRMIYKRTRTFQEQFSADINDERLILEHSQGGRTWQYKDFVSWFESPHFLHLYVGPNSFFMIPKESFSDTQLQEVRGIFKAQIGKK